MGSVKHIRNKPYIRRIRFKNMALKGSLSHKLLLPGSIFNRLNIISFSHSDKRARKWYNVECECGNKKVIMGSAMISGNTKSCGCYSKEVKQNKRIAKNHL